MWDRTWQNLKKMSVSSCTVLVIKFQISSSLTFYFVWFYYQFFSLRLQEGGDYDINIITFYINITYISWTFISNSWSFFHCRISYMLTVMFNRDFISKINTTTWIKFKFRSRSYCPCILSLNFMFSLAYITSDTIALYNFLIYVATYLTNSNLCNELKSHCE